MNRVVISASLLLVGSLSAVAQGIRGIVIDADTKLPIPFATVGIVGSAKGDVSDENGVFQISALTVGRYDLEASCVGYESKRGLQILASTGKQAEYIFELTPSWIDLDEVVITPRQRPDETINKMGGIAARSLMIDDAKRLAGSIGDPARLAANFAGVTTGNLQENGMVIRGNAPKGVLWRVEGVEVFNPNHIAGGNMSGGGFVNIFGSNLLGNSDFYTGAFPAEYGNSSSGVFDIHFRNGNTQQREHFAQVGILGVEAGTEGYFTKKSMASYNIGARISSLGTIGRLAKGEAPDYQDISLKIDIPMKQYGTLAIWGMGGLSSNNKPIKAYQEKWKEGILEQMKYPEYESDWYDYDMDWKVGAAGISHRMSLGEKSYLKSDLATSGMAYGYKTSYWEEVDEKYFDHTNNFHSEGKYTIQTTLNHRINKRITTRTGLVYDYLSLSYRVREAPKPRETLIEKVNVKANTWYLQAFSQAQYQPTPWLTLGFGVHLSHFGMTHETTIEPRASIAAEAGLGHTFGLSYGRHSQREELKIYFSPSCTDTHHNQDLKLQKSDHVVFTYNWLITNNIRFKVEPYYQKIYDVAVDHMGGSFSMTNFKKEWLIERDLVSNGTARNVGIDFTLERFFHKGWYFMLTGSLFDAKYVDGDGVERNSRYNRRYVANAMIGKEFIYTSRKGKSKVFGMNVKASYMGGEYDSPLLMEESLIAQKAVYDDTHAFSVKNPASLFVDASFYWKTNFKHITTSWVLEMKNASLETTFNGYRYNFKTKQMDAYYHFFIMPQLAYRVEF